MKLPLKYLFIADYSDGERFLQEPDDISKTREGGSAFSDVDHSRLSVFSLYSPGDDEAGTYSVDLRDGSFVVNGARFRMTPSGFPVPGTKLELIFWRQHQHDLDFKLQAKEEGKPGEIIGVDEVDHRVAYLIGWKAVIGGKDHIAVMEISG